MSELSIQLPPNLQRWVDARVSAGRYADAAEYLRDLVRRDQEALEEDIWRVRALVEEGIASGVIDREPEEVLAEIIAGIDKKDG
jgi:antitoxin ParD1/3/4